MTTEANFKRWSKILDTERFKVGESIKFKWVDLRQCRKTYRSERKTWTYGYITDIGSSRDHFWYLVEVVKGGKPRRGVNVIPEEARMWCPRKK